MRAYASDHRCLHALSANRGIEIARVRPQLRARRSQLVASFGDRLVPDRDLFVPAVDQPVPFEPRHQLIEGRGRSADAVRGQTVPNHSSWLFAVAQQSEHEKLQMGQAWELPLHRHKVTLCTMT